MVKPLNIGKKTDLDSQTQCFVFNVCNLCGATTGKWVIFTKTAFFNEKFFEPGVAVENF